jgi:hypothetical protein
MSLETLMAHKILSGPQPNIVLMELSGELNWEDMTCDEELGFNRNKPMYLMLDASRMSVNLPENFLDGAKQSFFTNDNLVHMALYLESDLLRVVANMVAKITRRKEKMSLHTSREGAIAHLQMLAQQARR